MNLKQFHRRLWSIALALALALTSLGSALYDLQINHGEDYYQQSQRKIAETETVEAARGPILDRNGRVLVSNRVVYQVTLNSSLMESKQDPADTRSPAEIRNATLTALLSPTGSLNYGRWQDSQISVLLTAFSQAPDSARESAAYSLYAYLTQQMPIAPICFKNGSVLTQWGRLSGLSPVRGNVFYQLENWIIS